jgi:AcrR family transcriptional regulator
MGEETDTRERILRSAAALLAKRGFHGTSTREVADVVGIRQPSLFHHFPSKHAILAELLDRDLGQSLERIRRYRASGAGAGAATCLYAHLIEDAAALIRFPFDARGLYNDAVLEEEPLASQRAQREDLHREFRDLVVQGQASGEFRDVDPDFAQQAITGVVMTTISAAWDQRVPMDPDERPRRVADFVLLGLLRDSSDLEQVRDSADELSSSAVAAG